MENFRIDRVRVRRNFGRAAASYERHDVLQRTVQQALLERLQVLTAPATVIADVGAGTGRGSALLKRAHPQALVVAVDLALPMLHAARRHTGWRRPFARVAGDATTLPLADASVNVLHSNLCFQWIDDLPALFAECARVLKPGGLLAFSTFGPDTLKELRAAWAAADGRSHVSRFLDMHDVGDAMLAAGLRDPVLDVDRYTLTYAKPRDLLDELRGLGATHADHARSHALAGARAYQRMLGAYEAMRANGSIPATWEVVTAHAWGVAPGQARRAHGGEVAHFPLDQLRGSRRR